MIVELHLLQNVSPSCLNRDDANAPKDCEFGGSRRARISSQCIKRSIRQEFKQTIPDKTGIRSKLIISRLAEKLTPLLPQKNTDEINTVAGEIVSEYFAKAGKNEGESSVLIFFDDSELSAIAEKAAAILNEISETATGAKSRKKDEASRWKNLITDNEARPTSIDIALFGRMLAEKPGKNIDGACQVAHAISTNRVQMEFDFFTAVDDLQPADQSGAGMMGTVGFNSSCFYRYAVVNVNNLANNLNNDKDAVRDAIRSFIMASFTAIPTGKQNSFAAHNPPSFGFAVVRETNMPWSLANAFERPIRPEGTKGLVAASIDSLAKYWESLSVVYNSQLALKGAAAILIPTDDVESLAKLKILDYKKNNLEEFIATIDQLITK